MKVLIALVATSLVLSIAPSRLSAQSSCNICRTCSSGCSCPPGQYGQFNVCCGAGGGEQCETYCQAQGSGCGLCVLCDVACPGTYHRSVACCNSSCMSFNALRAPLGAAGPTQPSGLVASAYEMKGSAGEYSLTFAKPVVAALVDVVYRVKGETVSIATAKYDNLLREGTDTVAGRLGGFTASGGAEISTQLRVWYVEYEDGSAEGELDAGRIHDEFTVVRDAVRAYSRKYAALVRAGRSACEEALATEAPVSDEERVAVAQVRAMVRAFPDGEALASRLERLAHQAGAP